MTLVARVGNDASLLPSLSTALLDPEVDEIIIEPGIYVEQVCIAHREKPLLIRSSTDTPGDVVVTFDLRQGDRNAAGLPLVQDCATLTIDADDVTIRGITVRNTFDKRLHPDLPETQALAVRTRGTRIHLERCRFLGRQDTLLLDVPSWGRVSHVLVEDCYIEGDVDFVYGRATALIRRGEVRSLRHGYIAAPSTGHENPRGLLFHGVHLTAIDSVEPQSVHLARPWHPGGKPDAVGQASYIDCTLGPHIAADRWADMGGYSWSTGGRFGEARSRLEPGAVEPTPAHDRPIANPGEAASHHLDGWKNPARRPQRIIILGDSTACEYGADRAPRSGWGQELARFLVGTQVINHAVSGMSTQSLIETGHLRNVLEGIGPRDVLLASFGHNDAKEDERHADPFRSFPSNLQRILLGARARGAQPILVTPVARRCFDGGRARSTHGAYPEAMRRVAQAENAPLIDLTVLSLKLWQEQGEETSKESFIWLEPGKSRNYPSGECDDTHLSTRGARLVAELIARSLKSIVDLSPSQIQSGRP